MTERWKCFTCKLILMDCEMEAGENGRRVCPVCHLDYGLVPMCERDHNHCSHPITPGVHYCDLCGEPICPECQSHDVVQLSRVTGYLQEVSGWNIGKQQELKDRKRYNIGEVPE